MVAKKTACYRGQTPGASDFERESSRKEEKVALLGVSATLPPRRSLPSHPSHSASPFGGTRLENATIMRKTANMFLKEGRACFSNPRPVFVDLSLGGTKNRIAKTENKQAWWRDMTRNLCYQNV